MTKKPSGKKAPHDLTSGSLASGLFRMSAPTVVALSAFVSMSVVDAFFVGRLGSPQLAALGFAAPVLGLLLAILPALSAAVQSVVSRARGSGDAAMGRRVTTHAVFFGLVIVAIGIVVLWLGMEPIFRLVGADDVTIPYVRAYVTGRFLGLFFVVMLSTIAAALLAEGDSVTPAVAAFGSSLMNAVLDPLLIFGIGPFPEMGVAGAAWSSTLAEMTLGLATAVWWWRRGKGGAFFTGMGESARRLGRVAVPVLLTGLLMPIIGGVLIRIVSGFGVAAVAGVTSGGRLAGLFFLLPNAVSMGLMAIVGQNWGAGLRQRVLSVMRLGAGVCIVWGLGAWALMAAMSETIAASFIDDAAAAGVLATFLVVRPASWGLSGVFAVANQTLNATDYASRGSAISVVQKISMVAGAFVGAQFGLVQFFVAGVVVEAVFGIFVWLYTQRLLKKAPMGADSR